MTWNTGYTVLPDFPQVRAGRAGRHRSPAGRVGPGAGRKQRRGHERLRVEAVTPFAELFEKYGGGCYFGLNFQDFSMRWEMYMILPNFAVTVLPRHLVVDPKP